MGCGVWGVLCGDVECGMWSVGGAVWGCRVWDVECGGCCVGM